MKRQAVTDSEWDHLIVLDACRYDTFESVYRDYVDGDLEKRESLGSATPEWAAKTFQDDHDITYFSANPFINGLGIPLDEMEWGASFDSSWTSTDHIATIHDVWDEVWDDDLGTVLPADVNQYVRNHWDEVQSNERTVVHYMQPHAPFIAHGTGRKVNTIRKSFEEAKAEGHDQGTNGGILSPLIDPVKPHIERFLEQSELAMKVGMLVELDPSSVFDVGTDGTRETLERYYEDNLREGFEAAATLADDLEGTVVITSDHGEAFGEQGIWEHHVETPIPALIEVPWLVVDEVH
ncbi:hypothetical protein [Halanaeroarchaeum sulfurireducens]|uniref:Sulfatase n=1 Tax=Halanaeroarchaeum sulfurireducens TaxID=1604004 RepID=A0A0F7PDT4_9EURY|nr:hypothetical protein [Halanaeroarchaeum sulfurireducens]AKH97498.1 hypothetical protein HLASF_1009 [Halanaeroarchaeum sulfurireducens]ALG81894.1 hypothetical protein HLASA_0998 [Halanaeroarchaeum sulfurireducens]